MGAQTIELSDQTRVSQVGADLPLRRVVLRFARTLQAIDLLDRHAKLQDLSKAPGIIVRSSSPMSWASPKCTHRARTSRRHCAVVPDPEAPPIRSQRHVENSIATVRRRLSVASARTLIRCHVPKPCDHSRPIEDHRDAVELTPRLDIERAGFVFTTIVVQFQSIARPIRNFAYVITPSANLRKTA